MRMFSNHSLCVRIIGALLPDESGPPWGMTEADIAKKCGSEPDKLLNSIRELIENKAIRHAITQEGTAGPYAHRYWLNLKDVDIVVCRDQLEVTPKAKSPAA